MWVTTHAFGLSTLTARLPALLGAAIYIAAGYFLCTRITDRLSLQLPLFVCLLLNPFIFDFMVAARGYSLADAFLMTAIAIAVCDRSSALASVALGLSFCANFSFAFVDLAAGLVILARALRRESSWRVAAACVLPGLAVALAIGGYTFTRMKKVDLYYGAHSLGEMARGLVDATLYQINPRFGGSLFKVMRFGKPLMLPALGILCAAQIAVTRRIGRVAAGIAGIAGFAVLLHWLAFHLFQLPLPMTRTGIFLLPLCTLMVGAIAAEAGSWLRRGTTAALLCLAFYFVLCLRVGISRSMSTTAM